MGAKQTAIVVGVLAVLAVLVGGVAYFALDHESSDVRRPDDHVRRNDSSPTPALRGHEVSEREGAASAAPVPPTAVAPERREPTLPTRSQLRAMGLLPKTPPGVLEAILLDGTVPLDRGIGILWRAGEGGGPDSIPANREPGETRVMARDGVFRFDGLAKARWFVGVDIGDGVKRIPNEGMFRTAQEDESERIPILLGDATIHGTVFDEAGRKAAGLRVRIGVQTGADLGNMIAETRTDAYGDYEVGRLPGGGLGGVTVAFAGTLDDGRSTRSLRVPLPAGQRTRVDVGSREGVPRLTGTLRFPDGEPILGARRIMLERRDPEEAVELFVGPGGNYDQRVARGRWRVAVWHPEGGFDTPIPLGITVLEQSLDVGSGDLAYDLVLPGARIRGVVRASDAVPKSPRWATLRRKGGDGRQLSVDVGADGTFILIGIKPGTYELHTGVGVSETVRIRSATVEVTVKDGDAEIRRDLELVR
jgi:hypothetical protein